MQNIPEEDLDFPFDDIGNYKNVHSNMCSTESTYTAKKTKIRKFLIFVSNMIGSKWIEDHVITDHDDVLHMYNQNVMPSKIDYEDYRSKLAWLPVNVIKSTFEWTTQFYCMPMGTYLKKRYKSPFPACNVHCRSEPVATDTVYS